MNDPRRPNRPNKPAGQGNDPQQPTSRFRPPTWLLVGVLAAIALWYAYVTFWPSDGNQVEVPYSIMLSAVRDDLVESIHVEGQSVDGQFTQELRWTGEQLLRPDAPIPAGVDPENVEQSQEFASTVPPPSADANFFPLLEEYNVQVDVDEETDSIFPQLLLSFLPIVLILGIILFIGRNMMRGQQNVFKFGSSKAKVHDAERPQVTFDDMAGEEEAKKELTEVVDFLKNPTKYHQLGAKLPRGVLLIGPPGTGKTLIARAVAGEANVPFFSVSASEFVEMFVGVGASRVRDLFEKAKAQAPAIVFIDELDAVGRQRFAGLGGSNDEREQTLNQILSEMDGFEERQEVIVLAATNRPDVLDPALLRPGRFDRQVTIGLPDKHGRLAVLKIHTRGIPIGDDVKLEQVAGGTPGFAGADLSNLVNEAALIAARHDRKVVTKQDFEDALDKIMLGTARSPLMNEHERKVVAYHEAGHAIVAHFSPGSDPLRKISIVPRGRSLGATIQTPTEDRYNYPRNYLLGRMATMMGGRAAEKLIFDEVTTGAQSDLKEATDLARRMVGLWGMSDDIGPLYLGSGEEHVFLGRELTQHKEIGESTQDRADAAVRDLVVTSLDRATKVLNEHREDLERLTDQLMTEETLDEAAITSILGSPPVPATVSTMDSVDIELDTD